MVGIEQRADVRADFEHDLCNVVGFVNAVGDLLKLAEIKRQNSGLRSCGASLSSSKNSDLPVVGKGVAGVGCHQNSNPPGTQPLNGAFSARVAAGLTGTCCCISSMMRCVSAGLVWVMQMG